jgi:hypothetical protein
VVSLLFGTSGYLMNADFSVADPDHLTDYRRAALLWGGLALAGFLTLLALAVSTRTTS